MATRKGINISGNYATPHIFHALFIDVLCIKEMKGRTKSYFTFFLKLKISGRYAVRRYTNRSTEMYR